MRKSLAHLNPFEKKEYYTIKRKERYKKKVGDRDIRPMVRGLTDEEKIQRRKDKYKAEHIIKNKNLKTMTPDELDKHKKAQRKIYNQRQTDKRKMDRGDKPREYNSKTRFLLKGLTDEEKSDRYKAIYRQRYKDQQEEKGIKVRPYIKQVDKKSVSPVRKKPTKEQRELNIKRSKDYYKKQQSKKGLIVSPQQPGKKYLINIDLTYQIILSKGKGDPTEKLKLMIYDICNGVNKRFYYKNEDIKYDIMMETYIYTLGVYSGYNEKKFNNAFAYITEIVKRSHTKYFRMESKKGIKMNNKLFNDTFYFVSIDGFNRKGGTDNSNSVGSSFADYLI